MTTADHGAQRRRPRRIASDEAHAWARNLRLGNAHAKYVLCMLTLYVNGDGSCFVGIDQIADDCELASETVRRRLAWLEEVGAIARTPQWIDATGKRNGDGRGKRTSDDIRLLVDADVDGIEACAAGGVREETAQNTDEFSPLQETGLNQHEGSVSPPLSPLIAPPLRTGPNALNLEPESPSKVPLRGILDEIGQKRFQEFKSNYPDGVVDLQAAEVEYAGLTETEQIACNAAELVYAARCKRRREKSMKAHLFVRKRAWDGLLANPETAAAPSLFEPQSPAGHALLTLGRMARYSPFTVADGRLSYRGEISERLLAMADTPPEFTDNDPARPIWQTYLVGSPNFAAWRGFINEVFAGRALPRLSEVYAPWPWPPRKDGSVSTGPPPDTLCTDQDIKDFAEMR